MYSSPVRGYAPIPRRSDRTVQRDSTFTDPLELTQSLACKVCELRTTNWCVEQKEPDSRCINVNEEGNRYQKDKDQTREKARNETVNHALGFKIHCAPGTAARIVRQHIPAISTRLCTHGVISVCR